MSAVDKIVAFEGRLVVSRCGGCRAALRGNEIHVEIVKPGTVRRKAVREFLGPLLDEEIFLTTFVPRDDHRSRRFVQALGFTSTWSDESNDYFILASLPFHRKESTCLQ